MENEITSIIIILFVGLTICLAPISYANATNESSYYHGIMAGSLKSPQIASGANWNPELDNNTCSKNSASVLNDAAVMPAITNVTACKDGWFAGYKEWCTNHAVDCVGSITVGDFPDMILKAHDQLKAGAKAANGSGISMCPIGRSQSFCTGWDSNNDDYGNSDCDINKYNYTGPFSSGLLGCPLDLMKPSQMAKPFLLVGTWNYVNMSREDSTISGKIVYGADADFNLTIPSHSGFGDYKLEGSWGAISQKILTECYAGGCENNTLTTATPNHIEFKDNNGNTIHLMREGPKEQDRIPIARASNFISLRRTHDICIKENHSILSALKHGSTDLALSNIF
jgi:hypothetical protein